MTIDYIKTSSNRKNYYNSGLRKYLISIYKNMTLALGITSLVAMISVSSQELMYIIHGTSFKWLIVLAPIIMSFYMSSRLMSISEIAAQNCLMLFSGLMGLSLSSVFLVFTGQSIAKVFFIGSSTFATMSIYGHNTKKDLSSLNSFLIMGSIGLLISTIVNIFLKSSAIYFISSFIGIIIFTLFTAYDTQRIKELYYENEGDEKSCKKLAIYGSLTLYMDFINLFIFLLQIIGTRRND